MACLPDYYKPKHFASHEYLPPWEYERYGDRGVYYFMDVRVLITADQVREFFGAPCTINNWWWKRKRNIPEDQWRQYSGYRPDRYYENTVQTPGHPVPSMSQHRFGRAVDMLITGVTATQARDIILNHQKYFPWICRIEDDVNWLHFDVCNDFHHGIHLFQPSLGGKRGKEERASRHDGKVGEAHCARHHQETAARRATA